jgi:hypothetical protein
MEDRGMTNLKRMIWLLCLGVSLSACAGDLIRWTEEVKLSDGRIVQLTRQTELTTSGFPVQKRGFHKYHEICYPPMNIRWKSKPSYLPDIFDIVDGKAYMHVPITGCTECMLHAYPETDALYFVWEGGRWKRIAHEQFPEKSEWNLLMSIKAAPGHEQDDPRGLVTITDKERRQSSARYEQKVHGWKRVNEGGKGIGRCNACRTVNVTTDQTPEIFIDDGKIACQP